MGIKLDGMTELKSQLERLGTRATSVQEEALKAGAEVVVEEATDRIKSNFIRRSGTLEGSVVKSAVRNGVIEVGPSPDGFYGFFLELGTKNISAKPFLQPAFEQNVNKITESMANVVRRELGL